MVWVYDKRPANGADFCYFGCVPIDSESHEAKILIPYCRAILDAMGVKHGASHAEIIVTPDGPCLVEMNCRANGGGMLLYKDSFGLILWNFSLTSAGFYSLACLKRWHLETSLPGPYRRVYSG